MAAPLHDDPDRASRAFGDRMRELRAREGVSQDGLADASGMHPIRSAESSAAVESLG
jgi:transcriptional regulator with XRE-family HTH domain